MDISDFSNPTEHPWGMLEGTKDAYEKEGNLAWFLMRCIQAGDIYVAIQTRLEHYDLVHLGLANREGPCLYTLTEKAVGLLYAYYGIKGGE